MPEFIVPIKGSGCWLHGYILEWQPVELKARRNEYQLGIRSHPINSSVPDVRTSFEIPKYV